MSEYQRMISGQLYRASKIEKSMIHNRKSTCSKDKSNQPHGSKRNYCFRETIVWEYRKIYLCESATSSRLWF